MSTPTLTPGDQKKDLNISQQHSDQLVNGLSAADRQPGTLDMSEFDNRGEIADEDRNTAGNREAAAATGAPRPEFINNVTPQDTGKKQGKWRAWFKRSAPILGGGGLVGITGFILVGMASPSLLIVQMKETMLGKFNTQLASMETRSNKLLVSKMSGATAGCDGIIKIRCKFTTMSAKQVAKLKAAGIEVEGKEVLGGRVKPTGLKYKDQPIAPKDFTRAANTNADFRSALKQAYNPKYAGFVGKAWSAVSGRFKISKQDPDLNAAEDKEKAKAKVNQIAQEGVEDTGSRLTIDASPEDCETDCTSQEKANQVNEEARNLDGAAKDGSAAADVRAKLSGIGVGSVTSAFKITALEDNACQVYGAVTALNYAAKAIRAAQLVRYAMIYLAIADAIKGGASPDPADVALLGDAATTVTKDPNDSTKTLVGSATDSFGYRYAQYGDTGGSAQSMQLSNRFMAGGGFVGEMSTAVNTIFAFIPGGRPAAKDVCKTLANPFVQGGSLLLGVASLLVPGVNVAKIATSAAGGIAVSVVLAVLPGMLADIVAGTVTNDLKGEEVGNALTSGSGALMSDALAGQNGNGLMTKDDAIAYNSLQTNTNNQYIADELRETSPFDATNPHTFVGSIVSSLLPLQSSSNPITAVSGFLATSVRGLVPSSSAVSQEDYAKSLDICQDQDALDAGYAVDPFCNVIRGIPTKYLDKDPVAVIDSLIANGDLNASDELPTQQYNDFISKCITVEGPVGYSDPSTGFDKGEANGCVISSSTVADRYLYYMDNRIELGMSGEDVDANSTTSVAGIAIDRDNLWEPSTSVACATGTTPVRDDKGYNQGTEIAIKLCAVPGTDEQGQPMLVNSRASGAVLGMINKMRIDLGIDTIKIADSFRTMTSQQHAWNCYQGNAAGEDCSDIAGRAAQPGFSNHQSGYAIDFQLPSGNSGSTKPGDKYWDWLSKNAAQFGYSSNVGESWHWSVTGG